MWLLSFCLLLMDNHGGRESSLGWPSVFVDIIVSEDSVVAVLLHVGITSEAFPTRPNYASNSYDVPDCVFLYFWSQLHHFPHYFMPLISSRKE